MHNSPTYQHVQDLQSYYKLHAPFYDATRWAFLFGRNALISHLPDLPHQPRILEVGCGTGKNIELLTSTFPDAHITGIDLSASMLSKIEFAAQDTDHVNIICNTYGNSDLEFEPFDLILFSYSIAMMGDKIESTLQQTIKDLKPKGYIAVVDFHATPYSWFSKWMGKNHVQIDGSLLPLLNKYYQPYWSSESKVYGGLWTYFQFIGQR